MRKTSSIAIFLLRSTRGIPTYVGILCFCFVGCFEIPEEPDWDPLITPPLDDVLDEADTPALPDAGENDADFISGKDTGFPTPDVNDTESLEDIILDTGPPDVVIPEDIVIDTIDTDDGSVCEPVCDGTSCGDDGCEGVCACSDDLVCVEEACVCLPDCDEKGCGDDGCGNTCGECNDTPHEICSSDGLCVCEFTGCDQECCAQEQSCTPSGCCVPDCAETGISCGNDGCGGSCGSCEEEQTCVEGLCCAPQCSNAECGEDECGGSCGTCLSNAECSPFGECVCQSDSVLCDDLCCDPGQVCSNNACCTPFCGPNSCGESDGCGNICDGCTFIADSLAEQEIQCKEAQCLDVGGTFVCASVPVPDQSPCESENLCTVNDICISGICQDGEPKPCPKLPCLEGACFLCEDIADPICLAQHGKCSWTPIEEPCSDENECTQGDQCLGSQCLGETAVECNDNNGCTTDSCLPEQGCVFSPNDLGCNDELSCTTEDTCQDGICTGSAVDCDDADPCTTDACEEGVGCTSYPLCDLDENCEDGLCSPAFMCDAQAVDGTLCGAEGLGAVCVQDACCFPFCEDSACNEPLCGAGCGQCSGVPSNSCDFDGCTLITPSPAMVYVAAGWYTRGCVPGSADPDCLLFGDESPSHSVYLPPFEMDQTEVSLDDFAAFVGTKGIIGCGENNDTSCTTLNESNWLTYAFNTPGLAPARFVTWQGAHDYCASTEKRLCTEAEWEKAARGTSGLVWPWGDLSPTCSNAIFGATCQNGPVLINTLLNGVSPYGVQHMAGNVIEWVDDFYGVSEFADVANGLQSAYNPGGPSGGTEHVLRGGSFYSPADDIRTGARTSAPGNLQGVAESSLLEPIGTLARDQVGFRCCRNTD